MDGGKRPDRGDNRDDDKGKRKATRRDGAPTRRLNLDSDEEEETGRGRGRGMASYRGRGRGVFSSTAGGAGSSGFNPMNNNAGNIVNPSNAGMIIPDHLDMGHEAVNQGNLEIGIDIANLLFPPAGGVLPPPVAPPVAHPVAPPPEEQEDEPEE